MHIYRCKWNWLISEGDGDRSVTIICGVPRDFAVVPAAGTCPMIDVILLQLCHSQSQGPFRFQLENQPKFNPKYFVQSHPNTEYWTVNIPPSREASVLSTFQEDRTSNCSQNFCDSGSSVLLGPELMLWNGRKHFCSDFKLEVPLRFYHLVCEVQLKSLISILIS